MNRCGRVRPGSAPLMTALAACAALALAATDASAGWPGGDAEDTGQVRASNLMLYQVGRDPNGSPDTLTELFNQFNLEYARGDWRVGLRADSFRPSRDDGFLSTTYDEITQKYVDWRDDGIHLRIGSGYTTLGRGLLFRAFELPGVIQDAVYPDSKYVDSRDLEGFIIDVDRGPLRLTALSGNPTRFPDYPYGLHDDGLGRRMGSVSGGHAAVRLHRGFEIGAGYLRTEMTNFEGLEEAGSTDLTLRLHSLIPELRESGAEASVYVEYAGRSWRPFSDGLDTDDETPHALYTATELSYGRWGLSYETKDYRDFLLGVNDPPNLVPEMNQRLLNRMSHFLLQDNERGHQLSVKGALPGDWTVHLESARAENEINGKRDYRLDFVGLESPAHGSTRGEVFAAQGADEVDGITDHWTVGGALDRDIGELLALLVVVEYQKVEREIFDLVDRFENIYLSAGVSRAGLGSAGVMAEFSNDPAEKDDILTFDVIETEPRRWLGAYATVLIGSSHEASFFAGRRRGGTACISGTCYLVPDFNGVEMRVSSRF
ncbi:hypothetical protein H8E07_09785 [bacterium]|nr:hypothetical protein [bacterium]